MTDAPEQTDTPEQNEPDLIPKAKKKRKTMKTNKSKSDADKLTEPTVETRPVKRQYKGEQEIDHDLFKLDVAIVIKNQGFDPMKPIPQHIEHCHFFHSFDSNGRPQAYSTQIGGHVHPITIKQEGPNFVGECGPPVRKVKAKRGIKFAPYNDDSPMIKDKHTHVVRYIESERIKPRKRVQEAANSIANREGEAANCEKWAEQQAEKTINAGTQPG